MTAVILLAALLAGGANANLVQLTSAADFEKQVIGFVATHTPQYPSHRAPHTTPHHRSIHFIPYR
jgi:hypothetical protein